MAERSQPRETFVLKVGQYDQPDRNRPATPNVPAVLPPLPEETKHDRLALANWLVDPANPLTARVTVNRIWQHHFGVGLVKTTEDFGVQGERPSHGELLDWLALELIRSGWNVKHLHRLIVTSSAYRQLSRVTPELRERDPTNRLLARGPRFRMTSFAIRDQALMLAGLLVEKTGGAPVQPYQPPGVWDDFSLGKIKYQRDTGEKLYRRSLYTFWRRSVAPTTFFDTASRLVCDVRTHRTNTPLHALTTLNDPAYVEAARLFAERMMTRRRRVARRAPNLGLPHGNFPPPDGKRIGRPAAGLRAGEGTFRKRTRCSERVARRRRDESQRTIAAGRTCRVYFSCQHALEPRRNPHAGVIRHGFQ